MINNLRVLKDAKKSTEIPNEQKENAFIEYNILLKGVESCRNSVAIIIIKRVKTTTLQRIYFCVHTYKDL